MAATYTWSAFDGTDLTLTGTAIVTEGSVTASVNNLYQNGDAGPLLAAEAIGNLVVTGNRSTNLTLDGLFNTTVTLGGGNDTIHLLSVPSNSPAQFNGGAVHGGKGWDTLVLNVAFADVVASYRSVSLDGISLREITFTNPVFGSIVVDGVEEFKFSDQTLSYTQIADIMNWREPWIPQIGYTLSTLDGAITRYSDDIAQGDLDAATLGIDVGVGVMIHEERTFEALHLTNLNPRVIQDITIAATTAHALSFDNFRYVTVAYSSSRAADITATNLAGGTFALGSGGDSLTITTNDSLTPTKQQILVVNTGGGNDVISITGSLTLFKVTLDAGSGNDTIVLTAAGSHIVNLGTGNDHVTLGDGNDYVYGGSGNDVVFAGGGNDHVYLNDVDSNTDSSNTVHGGDGDDYIAGATSKDTVYGDAGNDSIFTYGGVDTIYGGDGNDHIRAGLSSDIVYGDAGDDYIDADEGNDKIWGGDGNDTIVAGIGNDTIYGDAGDDVIYGEDGTDIIWGGDGNDMLHGGSGKDTIYGEAGNDRIYADTDIDKAYGGLGDDILVGFNGDDTLYGDEGNDIIDSGNNNDKLYGGDGIDVLTAGLGNDTLDGGAGADQLTGGGGKDRFVFTDISGGVDKIQDFVFADDKIDLAGLLQGFGAGANANNYVRFIDRGNGRADIQVNADGQGNDWGYAVTVYGQLSGHTVNEMVANGKLIL